ncbi:uncharacterized protein TRUGW13939_04947 [Talaromyces rugulosus]|uniref:Uncharacterized protein n=1 Tax=Talaromyces rugulosus TaxID=121627 RepID=A0A7H8QV41_TALRU|nr:uncharacterized protein TRUGW13939_04947 [Talaromyces rugulosus]QKX57827.1 hypothetical protein TRUGW13939_04947 [Talaromyces rugulosus]
MGNNLMLVGLIFQILTLGLFAVLCLEFIWRVKHYPNRKRAEFQYIRESRRFQGFLVAAFITFITIFIRCVYRVVELAGGWNNKLQREETPFIILESGMVSVAVFAFALFHPGRAFDDSFGNLYSSVEKSSRGEDAEMKLMPQ